MKPRDLGVAQHEAAHVVVGVALGLRLHAASALPSPEEDLLGYTWFPYGPKIAQSLCTAAGVAWEETRGGGLHAGDLDDLRRLERSEAGARAAVRAARAMLSGLKIVHRKVTRALMRQDIRHAHIDLIARGEWLAEADE